MTGYDLVVRSSRAFLPAGPVAAAVCVLDGRIAAIEARDAMLSAERHVDLDDLALLPGLVDTHVHVNEPGRTEWEGFRTATAAAAAGGVTTIVDMPLNSVPPTTTVAGLEAKRAAAEGAVHVDVGFWGGAVPGNLDELAPLHAAGVFGFKCFTAPSGVDEFPRLDWPGLPAVLRETARLDALLIAHCEDADALDAAPPADGAARFADFLASRPPGVEDTAVARLAAAAADAGARAHVVHLSSAGSVPLVAAARAAGTRLTAETCPHYLTLAAEAVPDGATEFKCCPPIRGADNAGALWRALADGTLACVVSDHSPCPADLKAGDFGSAWGGIASVQLGLPVVWTAAWERGVPLADVVRWMAAGPADLVGLSPRKGRIVVGADADLVAFAPDDEFTVDPAALRHRHPVTPYAGARLRGVVHRTWLRGVDIGTIDQEPRGVLLTRP
ncbi:MAG TPA: allantoinase AllB [Pseudonocardiaceae bacterium]